MIFYLFELPEREFQLIGLDYIKRVEKYLTIDDLVNLRKLVLSKSWWDSVDTLINPIGHLVFKEPVLKDTMRAWRLNDNLWLRRVSILHQLSFKEKTDTALLQEVIVNNVQDDEFFIQKAIGWALRDYVKADTSWVKKFVVSSHDDLSALSIRESMKNIND